ncbi:hypothetical protein HZF24_10290 [Sedimentibacter hydroxybenzoicus DSM 7310]|uniref:Uncharacterized protein n=1 Tax=Sedimentibacter hydroxybenzoicus DSM 7310 TaxID=1123245 RepID=A0A974BJV6_SEDHY|nr:hypothetical protein [Sedimentibacter hydroxybenzoicus]NYB74523.1 hypothetical protein [Sedimentibacter hydroxybenzoicus DSM 7310]
MAKLKYNLKNFIYSIKFLFRPIAPVAVSLVFLAMSFALLVFILFNIDESTKAYQVLLAILTGVTASLLIAIMMELYNNYRFNVKRQRELREFFRVVANYKVNIDSIIKTNDRYENILGNGRSYAIFCQLYKIVPKLKEALNNRDYLYQKEIEEIDDILYEYDDLLNIIHYKSFEYFLGLIVDETEDQTEFKGKPAEQVKAHEFNDDSENTDEAISSLLKFLEKEAKKYENKERDSFFYDEAPEYLKSIIEKAIFMDRHIFRNYFEVTDKRYESSKKNDGEEYLEENKNDKDTGYEFRSNMISLACGNIDKSMTKLQKRAEKEPYFWIMASYKEKNKVD